MNASIVEQLPDIRSKRMKKIELFRTLYDYSTDSWAIEVGDVEFPVVRKTGFKTLEEAEKFKEIVMKQLQDAEDGNVENVLESLIIKL